MPLFFQPLLYAQAPGFQMLLAAFPLHQNHRPGPDGEANSFSELLKAARTQMQCQCALCFMEFSGRNFLFAQVTSVSLFIEKVALNNMPPCDVTDPNPVNKRIRCFLAPHNPGHISFICGSGNIRIGGRN